jgi:hypothetical protein
LAVGGGHEIDAEEISRTERLGQDLVRSTAEEGGNGRKALWGHADDLPQAAGYENAEIRKTKAGKKADNKKKNKGERGKRKGGTPGLGYQVNN